MGHCQVSQSLYNIVSQSVKMEENSVLSLNQICNPAKDRNSTMDLLRCFAIFFIVAHHLVINNLGLSAIELSVDTTFLGHYLSLSLIDCFAIIGVNVFFASSGYFSAHLSPKKMVALVIQVYVYWLLGMLIAWAVEPTRYATVLAFLKEFIVAIAKYWFVIVYMLLLLCAPFLNRVADYITQKTSRIYYFFFITILFFCVIGFISDYIYPYMGTDNGYTVIWAAIPYLYGRIIRLKSDSIRKSVPLWTVLYIVFSLCNYAVIAPLIGCGYGKLAWHFYSYNNPLVLASSLCFVMIFVSAKEDLPSGLAWFSSMLASHTLAIYLLHSNNPFLSIRRAFLINLVDPFWAKLLILLPNVILIVGIGIVIDTIYQILLKKPVNRFSAWIEKGILFIYDKFTKLCKKIFSSSKKK